MKNYGKLVVISMLAAGSSALPAYELVTHAAMSYRAYVRSKLATDKAVARDLGIDWMLVDPTDGFDPSFKSTNPFGRGYIDTDPSSGADKPRQANLDFEGFLISNRLGMPFAPLTLPGWMMRGAVREDDSGKIYGFGIGAVNEPYDDPYGSFNRWCNHFFDPTKGTGLRAATFFCLGDTRQDSLNWAKGTLDAYATPPQVIATRRNHFTVSDAREALYRAVTGLRRDGSPVTQSGADVTTAANLRKSYYATVFRSLGDVIHLSQDTAQPQHTRNESHAGINGITGKIGGDPAYEKHIDYRASLTPLVDGGGAAMPVYPLMYDGYGVPRFSQLTDYWSTAPGSAIPMGAGLADYSSREFFTLGNNYGDNSRYLSPPSTPSKYSRVTSSFTYSGKQFTYTYLQGTVTDNRDQSSAAIRMSVESVWKSLTSGAASAKSYTQDARVFDDMASQLVPRAVGYSVGILDHFFRGKLQISAPDGGVYAMLDHSKVKLNSGELLTNFKGFGKIRIRLSAPVMGNDGLPQSFGGGKLLAVIKFRRNTCFDDALANFVNLDQPDADGKQKFESCRTQAEEIIVSDPINGGATFTPTTDPKDLTLTFQKQLPLNATDVRLQVVYRGKLGVEDDDVVVATQDISEASFFSYMNASDYWTLDMGGTLGRQVFTRSEINASQALLQKVYPQSCVDKTLLPWQLKPGCFQPFDVRLGLYVGKYKVDVQALPVRRLMRIAFLGDKDVKVNLAQIDETTCFPHTAFDVATTQWESFPDPDNNPFARYPEFSKIRGVWGWYGTSCVGNGDGGIPGGADNRNTVMTDLVLPDRDPVEVVIDDGDPAPPP